MRKLLLFVGDMSLFVPAGTCLFSFIFYNINLLNKKKMLINQVFSIRGNMSTDSAYHYTGNIMQAMCEILEIQQFDEKIQQFHETMNRITTLNLLEL